MKLTIENLCNGLIPTKKQRENLEKLCYRLNVLFSIISTEYKVVAGLVTPENAIMKEEGTNSPLTTGEAVLFEDKDFSLTKYLLNNIEILEREGLYLKNPAMTINKLQTQTFNKKAYMINYVLLQIRPASSTVFNEE